MIESPLRLVVSWMADGVTGLNAQLAGVPRPGGEDPPPAVLLYNELEHPWVARNIIHRDALKDVNGPRAAVIIRFPELEPEAEVRQPLLPEQLEAGGVLVPVLVQYARRKVESAAAPANSSVLVRQARQTMRAAIRVVALHFPNAHQTYEQDQCDIGIASGGVQLHTRYIDFTDDEVLDQLLIPFVVMDRWAMGVN